MKNTLIVALALALGLFLGNAWSSKAESGLPITSDSSEGRFKFHTTSQHPSVLLDTKTGNSFILLMYSPKKDKDGDITSPNWTWFKIPFMERTLDEK